ncbi:transposase [Colletotrichum incanum]|uniref:Transposase n=1 Tax=Colletotrichum incanum TaxID=1573173 RepID=A0A167CG19_COLIC|nr:transposase [Colletotrichum incanum]
MSLLLVPYYIPWLYTRATWRGQTADSRCLSQLYYISIYVAIPPESDTSYLAATAYITRPLASRLKYTGLWPVNVARPLSSPFVSKASARQPDSQTARQSGSQQWDAIVSEVLWSTPLLERQIQALQSQQDNRRKGKRRAVDPDPNSTFVNIANIRQSEVKDTIDECGSSELSSEAESCIWVGGRDEE